MEALDEIERLLAEQRADDSHTIRREFRGQVPLTKGIANHIGVDLDGEITTYWKRPRKGTLLIGAAPWHGTRGGYVNHKCRCKPCTKANASYFEQRRSRDS